MSNYKQQIIKRGNILLFLFNYLPTVSNIVEYKNENVIKFWVEYRYHEIEEWIDGLIIE
jgi:hypothetical protein